MNRYLSSFIITAILYITLIASVLYVGEQSNYSDKNLKADDVKKVNFTIVAQEKKPKPIPKPKVKPKPKPKSIKKSKPEPIKKEPQPIKKVQEEQIQKKEIATIVANKKACDHKTKAKKELFISNLIKQINSNKSYPRSARRRGIEGVVNIGFIISADGNVKDVNVISGKDVFKNSTIKAIQKSFPIDIDLSLFEFPKKFKIKIAYILK